MKWIETKSTFYDLDNVEFIISLGKPKYINYIFRYLYYIFQFPK